MNKVRLKLHAFYLGVIDALGHDGALSLGFTWDAEATGGDAELSYDLSTSYDRGANVGEWLWDLTHGQSVRRAPWVMRSALRG